MFDKPTNFFRVFCGQALTLVQRCGNIIYAVWTISSAGMSIRLTCGRSQVQVLYRPPEKSLETITVSRLFFSPGAFFPFCFPFPPSRAIFVCVETNSDLNFLMIGKAGVSFTRKHPPFCLPTVCRAANRPFSQSRSSSVRPVMYLYRYARISVSLGRLSKPCPIMASIRYWSVFHTLITAA